MKLEVLVATMNQENHELIKKMNISTDAVIANQCNNNDIKEFSFRGKDIKYINTKTKGVGINRNIGLLASTGDILLFADDDILYEDDYEHTILKEFEKNPKADIIIFNLYDSQNNRYQIKERHKVGYFNYMRYGTVRIAAKKNSLIKHNITFNQNFGGGSKYGSGEDTLFLTDCLKAKLNIYAVPKYIGTIKDERDSTWFKGFNEKYFKDKGALFYNITKKFYFILIIQFALRNHSKTGSQFNKREKLKLLTNGIRYTKL